MRPTDAPGERRSADRTDPATGPSVKLGAEELEALHVEDQHAARIIVCLLASVFTTGLAMYLYIAWLAAN